MNTSRRHFIAGAIAMGMGAPAFAAQTSYPDHMIRFVIGFPPGAGTDFIGRALAQKLTEILGQSIVIENRDGANGSIGAEAVAKAAPDGYTMLLGPGSTMAVNPHLLKSLPYKVLTDFTPVALVASVPSVLFANSQMPFATLKELIAYAKQNPGKLNYSSAGNGSVGHLAGAMLSEMAGIDIVHVPFRGSAPAMTSVLSGHVQMTFDSAVSGMPHVKEGQLRVLGQGSPTRSSLLPDIPTMAEQGLPDFRAVLWYGVFLPANAPRDVVARLGSAIETATRSKDLIQTFGKQGMEAAAIPPGAFEAYWKDEYARWGKVIQATNVSIS